MLKNTTLGYYEPSFFEMRVNTRQHLDDLNKLSIQDQSVFLHEYTHFLQDILTSFGLVNLCNVVNTQKAINEHIIQQTSTFKIPIDFELSHPDVYNTSLAFDMYWGENDSDFNSYCFINEFGFVDGFVKGYEKQIPWVYVEYINGKKEKKKCHFGALAIMESMSYMLQSMLCQYVPNSPEYPYHFVENLANNIYPEIANDKIILILLCDIALNTYHPGKFLYEILTRWSNDKFVPKTYKEIYEYASDYKFRDINDIEYSFENLYEKSVSEGKDAFTSYFTVPNFDAVKNWGISLIDMAAKIRREQPYFWIDILDRSTKQDRLIAFFSLFYTNLGGPLMTNDLEECTFSADQLYQGDVNLMCIIRGIKQIRYYVSKRNTSCLLSNYCKKSIDMTQMNCKNPWQVFLGKDSSKIQLCPFNMMLKAWGLYKKQPE